MTYFKNVKNGVIASIGENFGCGEIAENEYNAYKAATNWSKFAKKFLAIEDYPEIATWEEWWK